MRSRLHRVRNRSPSPIIKNRIRSIPTTQYTTAPTLNTNMVKSLPYLPTKASMSIKRRITLKPRFQRQLPEILLCKSNNNTFAAPMDIMTPRRNLYDDQTINEVTVASDISDEPFYLENDPTPRHQKQTTHLDNTNIYHCIAGNSLPYLPSCDEVSDEAFLSSKIYWLEPRTTSKAMFPFSTMRTIRPTGQTA